MPPFDPLSLSPALFLPDVISVISLWLRTRAPSFEGMMSDPQATLAIQSLKQILEIELDITVFSNLIDAVAYVVDV